MKDALLGITAVLGGIAGSYALLGLLFDWAGR